MPEIRLQQLVKRYGAVQVLHGIDLQMAENEFTVLVGPSGCGKSTTLRMVAGLEAVSDGDILMNEASVKDLDPKDRDIAMVFQDYALYPHMNVARNMSFSLRLQKTPKAEIDKKVKEVAEILGLSAYLGRKPGELSGGQRQRVAMGRALCRDAGTFLFDEPLSNLDAKLRGQMRAELAVMRQSVQKNMIYVTHDQIEAMTLADRIVVMHGGHIQQQGTPAELFKNPANKFVAGFLGSPPMNFLAAELKDEGGTLYAVGKGFQLALDPDLAERSRRQAVSSAILGIRPSDLEYNPDGAEDASIDLNVVVSEYVGAQSVLICDCGGSRVTVEIKSETPIALGETLRFAVRQEGLHLFDNKTEDAI
ncbi:sn-glycerol-3-phosphate ABC transporter ATP-binding protein UgpC [Cognatiyoonia sp. IB215446]|uniref:ABC transporter ATP-binding protein n=1 Tax=Cognatiyoonia sp. IB215446 TaxID=3097355 RepID=UPI002A0BC375|nr:sn-glycerol-3-phosphate ABC transporter ATP-binding protein UgpC [Cognatiyoonia sp. IB215446]MDX8350232.1 sn-glycerol-3-phosphate ABC transporter ATP-binding protein UgpC [Cognatiyoonia sp. IB215446]